MLANTNSSITLNNFMELPLLPYKVFEYLAQSKSEEAEMLWKLLKYSTADCLSMPNLTYEEKVSMIWSGQTNEEDFALFNKPLVTNSLGSAEEMNQIRMFRYGTIPNSKIEATVLFELDIYTNDKTACVFYNDILCEKTDLEESLLLSLLNGVDLGIGYNFLRFDRENVRSSQSMANISNSKSFFGRTLMLSLSYSNIDSGGICG